MGMNTSYDRLTKYFHWGLAILIVAEYVFVWLIPEGTRGPNALASYHMSFGIVILALIFARIVWRGRVHTPPHPEGMPSWQIKASLWTHGLLYALLVVLPLSGWLWVSANGWHVTLFGVVDLPPLLAKQPALGAFFSGTHEFLASAVLALVALHTLAALYHWLIVKDNLMQNMWP